MVWFAFAIPTPQEGALLSLVTSCLVLWCRTVKSICCWVSHSLCKTRAKRPHICTHTHTHQRDTHLRDLTQIDASGLTCPFSKRWCELTWTSHERSKCFIFFLIRFDRLSTDSCFCALTTSVCVIFILCARWASVDAPQMIALYGTRLSALGEGHSFVHLSTLSSLNWLYRQLCHFTWFPPFLSDNCCCCLLQIQQETHIWVIISWVNLNDHFFQAALSTFHKAQSELWPQMCWHIASGKRQKMEE